MKKGWEIKTLGEVCQIIGGGTPSKGIPEFYTGDIPWATVRDMRQDVITKTEFKITSQAVRQSSTNIIPGNNVIIATRVGLGKICLVAQDTAINQDLRGIIPIDPDKLEIPFLFWWLKSVAHIIEKEGTGATVQGVKLPFIKGLLLPLPPLPEQQRIVAILNEAFEGIAKAKANAEQHLKNARELFESHLQAVFSQRGEGWVEERIGDHIRFIDYRGKTPTKTQEGVRLITAKNIKMGYLQEYPKEYVAPESYSSWMIRGVPRKGDILFTTEAPLANIAQLDTDERVVFAQRVIIMQPEATIIDSSFLKYLLMSKPVQAKIHMLGTGATVKGIKASLLKSILVSFPEKLSEQKNIVSVFDKLLRKTQRLESIYQRKIAALDELKKSLLHKAFSGEL